MVFAKLHYYPILAAIIFPFTFVVTFTTAYMYDHIDLSWPFISDTGTIPPESCFFGQFLNVGALLLGITSYVRFKQVEEFFKSHGLGRTPLNINLLALWTGWLAVLGVTFVANFQETAVNVAHFTGAFMIFGVGTLYLWLQAYCTTKLTSIAHSRRITQLRIGLAVIATILITVMTITGKLAFLQIPESRMQQWKPPPTCLALLLISSVSEWLVVVNFSIFLLTFVGEFKLIALEAPKVRLQIDEARIAISSGSLSLFDEQNDN